MYVSCAATAAAAATAATAVATAAAVHVRRFKPGVEGILLLFSDNEGNTVYEFPMYRQLRDELEPLLTEVCICCSGTHQPEKACRTGGLCALV